MEDFGSIRFIIFKMIILISLILVFNLKFTEGVACGNTTVGADPGTAKDIIGTNSGYGYLMTGEMFTFRCCGLISRWEILIKNKGDIYLQVWRADGLKYKMVGSNFYSLNEDDQLNTVLTLNVAASHRITVQDGDHIGLYLPGTDMIPYRTGGANNNFHMAMATPPTTTSPSTTWSGTIYGRTYAVRATTANNTPPWFENLDFSRVYVDTSNQRPIYTLTVNDGDPYDVTDLTIKTETESDKFFIDDWKRVRPKMWDVGVYHIICSVTDSCGNSARGTLNFTLENTAPVIAAVPLSNVDEGLDKQKNLQELSVTDKQNFNCYILFTVPPGGPFVVKLSDVSTNLALFATGTPKLNYTAVKQYIINITCVDDLGLASYTLAIVNVNRNKPPTMDQLPDRVSVSTLTANGETEVYSATALDTDSDQLFYSMTCSKQPCIFEINQAGKIKPKHSLNLVKETTYDLYISVYDNHTLVGPKTLTIDLTDVNSKPNITNLPSSIAYVPENSALNTNVFTIEIADGNANDDHTYRVTFYPGDGASYFQVNNKTGEISVKADIDYEALYRAGKLKFEASVTVDDGREVSDPKRLTLMITDVNEPQIKFVKDKYQVEIGEMTTVNPIQIPGFSVMDTDLNDIQKYTMDCGTQQGKFSININTGVVTQNEEYDLDGIKKESKEFTCLATATDLGNHTITTDVKFIVTEINDNDPIFVKRQYDFLVPQCTPVGNNIGTTIATDKDVKLVNKDISYELTYVSGSSDFEEKDGGGLYVAQDLCSVPVGTTYEMMMTAKNDLGGDPLRSDSVPVTVVITQRTTTTSTVVTTPTSNNNGNGDNSSFLDYDENLKWFIPAMVLLAGLLALLCYVCLQLCRDPGLCSRIARICNCKNLCKNLCRDCNSPSKNSPRIKVKEPCRLDGKYEFNLWAQTDFKDRTIECR